MELHRWRFQMNRNKKLKTTFVIDPEDLENLKAIAYWDRVSMKDIVTKLIREYVSQKDQDCIQKAKICLKAKNQKEADFGMVQKQPKSGNTRRSRIYPLSGLFFA